MSQVDKLNYVPLLVWFVILITLLYLVVYVHFLPLAYSIVYIRTKFLQVLVGEGYGLTTMLLQLVGFTSKVSVPAVNAMSKGVMAAMPAYIYSYIIIR